MPFRSYSSSSRGKVVTRIMFSYLLLEQNTHTLPNCYTPTAVRYSIRQLFFFFPFRFCSHQLLNSLYFMYLYSNILVHTETSTGHAAFPHLKARLPSLLLYNPSKKSENNKSAELPKQEDGFQLAEV